PAPHRRGAEGAGCSASFWACAAAASLVAAPAGHRLARRWAWAQGWAGWAVGAAEESNLWWSCGTSELCLPAPGPRTRTRCVQHLLAVCRQFGSQLRKEVPQPQQIPADPLQNRRFYGRGGVRSGIGLLAVTIAAHDDRRLGIIGFAGEMVQLQAAPIVLPAN